MKKVLTVLIPVYNTEKYIKRCLDSLLLKKTNDIVELLVVSDGSKDNAINIVKKYQEKYPKTITLVEKENGGHGSTINVGIKKAKGKYFKVIDSDDWVNSIDFIKLVDKLKKENSDLIVTNYSKELVYSGDSQYIKYDGLRDSQKYYFDKFNFEDLKGEYFVMATSTYKTTILRESNVELMEKTFYVDMQYNLLPIKKVETFTYYDLDIYRYFIGRAEQSVNTFSFVKNKNDHEKVLKFMITYLEKEKNNLSKIKHDYLKMIINYTLYTHYTIFCLYDDNHKDAYEKIKKFDEFLKNTSEELYIESDKMGFTRCHRKTKFYFVKRFRKIYSKVCTVLKKVRG